MVDLPPTVSDLNEYARFAFVNEMCTIGTQISILVSEDRQISSLIAVALQVMEAERASMRDLFKGPYERPPSQQCVALLLRCAELYLEYGHWIDITHADVRIRELGYANELDQIRNAFHKSEMTDRYSIASAIIELTITRLEMMKFFEMKQNELYKGFSSDTYDPHCAIEIPAEDVYNEAENYSSSIIPDDFDSPDNLFVTDKEYLYLREQCAWAAFRDFQILGSVFVIIWYVIFAGFSIASILKTSKIYPVTEILAVGYSVPMLIAEIVSCRICLVSCIRPKESNCLYPGYELYYIQYTASWIGGIILIASIFLNGQCQELGATVLILQHAISVIVPLFFRCCFFTWHQRVERKFKWIRVGFFRSCWWKFVQALFCLLFTPGILGVQTIIAGALRNSPRVKSARRPKQQQI